HSGCLASGHQEHSQEERSRACRAKGSQVQAVQGAFGAHCPRARFHYVFQVQCKRVSHPQQHVDCAQSDQIPLAACRLGWRAAWSVAFRGGTAIQ
ncbi:hypothetical protein H4218_006395, partial [Coemansia sp. IMI 209128]